VRESDFNLHGTGLWQQSPFSFSSARSAGFPTRRNVGPPPFFCRILSGI